MAEETTILIDEGSESSSGVTGLETSGETDQSHGEAAGATTNDLKQEIENLKRQNAQYLRERNGWEQQSRRNLDESRATQDRIARLEGQLAGRSTQDSSTPQPAKFTPGKLKSALQKWINNDESELDEVEQVFANLSPREQQNVLKPEDVQRITREHLVELGTKSNLQTLVATRHPDMENPNSPLSAAVWDQYEAYAADPQNQLLFGKSPTHEVPMIGPDGSRRLVDARIVNQLATELRLQGGIQEGRRQESRATAYGAVQTGNGRTTTTNPRRTVEAIDLLTPEENRLLMDPAIRKGWRELPADPKAAAKFIYDGLSPQEKAKRMAAYRSRSPVTV